MIMMPYCGTLEDEDAIEHYSEFDGIYNNMEQPGINNVKTENQSNMSSLVLNHLDAPYLSISPMLALSDGFDTRSEEDEGIDLPLDRNFQSQYHDQSFTDIHESLSSDQCNTFDQIRSNWSELDIVPQQLLKYELLPNSKWNCCADPTLAELNANGKSIFDDLSGSDCLPLSEECSQFKFPTVPTSPQDSQDALVLPTSGSNSLQSIQLDQTQFLPNLELVKTEVIAESSPSPRRSTLQDLLLQDNSTNKRCSSPIPQVKVEIQKTPPICSVPPDYVESKPSFSELVAPFIKRRQRTSTISSTSSACESLPGTSVDALERFEDEYQQDGCSTDKQYSECSDSDGDDSTQSNDSGNEMVYEGIRRRTKSLPTEGSKPKRRNKRGRYFWQYNLQAKGPKGNRLSLAAEFANPHKMEQVTDPVFSPRCIIKGIKHTGKARKGDGNDLTPNPEKLYQIGQSLKNLNQIINDLTPVNELPINIRPKSRKEKNKLASRVCRLKKKAQHEANKLKLYGLQHEREHLMHILKELKKLRDESTDSKEKLLQRCVNMEIQFLNVTVAGRTVEFVNEILDKVASGIPSGGLEDL